MKNIIFIAPPAAGKGTQSELLVSEFGYNHISTGDLLRLKQNDGSELGNYIEYLLSQGKLVDDDIVTSLLKEKLSNIDGPFILDGYPRNILQADILDNVLKSLNLNIDAVIYLNVDSETAMKRALGRVSCPKCNKIYNKYISEKMPKVANVCDDCGVQLICRSDDNEISFKKRFDAYINQTQPLLDYYKSKDLLVIVDRVDTPNDTFEEVKKVIL